MRFKSYFSAKLKLLEQLFSIPIMLFSTTLILGIILYDKYLALIFLAIFLLLQKKAIFYLALLFLITGSLYSSNYLKKFECEVNIGSIYNEATIVEPAEIKSSRQQLVVNINSHLGNSIVTTNSPEEFLVGDKVMIKGGLKALDKTSNFGKYLKSKKVNSEINDAEITLLHSNNLISRLSRFRQRLIAIINSGMRSPESSLFSGILLGAKDSFEESLEENLTRSGTTHIVSASGSNVLIIYILLQALKGFINKKYLDLISIIAIIFYLFMIGSFILPALRATVMIVLLIFGKMIGRKNNVLISLNISIIFILIIYPLYYQNISFQLSLFASLGLFLLGPVVSKFLKAKFGFIPDSLNEILGATLSAIVATMPVILLSFGSVAFLAILSNLLIIPFISIIMIAGIIALFMTLIKLTFISSILFILIQTICNFMIRVIDFFGGLKFGYWENKSINILVFVLLLFLFLFYDVRRYEKSH